MRFKLLQTLLLICAVIRVSEKFLRLCDEEL
jgi:hypothetical protein